MRSALQTMAREGVEAAYDAAASGQAPDFLLIRLDPPNLTPVPCPAPSACGMVPWTLEHLEFYAQRYLFGDDDVEGKYPDLSEDDEETIRGLLADYFRRNRLDLSKATPRAHEIAKDAIRKAMDMPAAGWAADVPIGLVPWNWLDLENDALDWLDNNEEREPEPGNGEYYARALVKDYFRRALTHQHQPETRRTQPPRYRLTFTTADPATAESEKPTGAPYTLEANDLTGATLASLKKQVKHLHVEEWGGTGEGLLIDWVETEVI